MVDLIGYGSSMFFCRNRVFELTSLTGALGALALLVAACSSSPSKPEATQPSNKAVPSVESTQEAEAPSTPQAKLHCEAALVHLNEEDPDLACIRARVSLHCEKVEDDLTEDQAECFNQVIYAEPDCVEITNSALRSSDSLSAGKTLSELCGEPTP